MGSSLNVPLMGFAGLLSLPLMAALTVLSPTSVRAQEPPRPDGFDRLQPSTQGDNLSVPINVEQSEVMNQPDNPDDLRPLSQEDSLLSMEGGKRLMDQARMAAAEENYEEAINKLQQSREIFNQLSNFHQQLSASFTGIDNRISDNQRTKAVESAELRDLATYELAIVHRAQNRPELAVPLLIQIIRSQQPTRDLGKKAYQQLWELGFVDSPYPPAPQNSSNFSSPR